MRVGSALKVLAPSAGVLALFASTIAFGTSIGFAETASDWEPGPNAAGEYFCSGAIDSPNAGSVIASGASVEISGWIADMSATCWAGFDDLHVYDGTAGTGRFLTQGAVGLNRPDVAIALGNPYYASSGFLATIPAGELGNGQHTLTVYALLLSVCGGVLIGLFVVITPVGAPLGFAALPPLFFGVLVLFVVTYLGLVQSLKRRFYAEPPVMGAAAVRPAT